MKGFPTVTRLKVKSSTLDYQWPNRKYNDKNHTKCRVLARPLYGTHVSPDLTLVTMVVMTHILLALSPSTKAGLQPPAMFQPVASGSV